MRPGTGLAGVRWRYAREAGRYDRRWARYLERSLGPTLHEVGAADGLRLLDVGCGTGLLLERVVERWPTAEAYGVDLSAEMLSRARTRLPGRVRLLRADAHRLPLAGEAFDLVLSTSALHHWAEPEAALAEIARVLRPGGRLVLTDWSDDDRWLRIFSRWLRLTDPAHHRSYTAAEVGALLERAGLRVERTRRFRAGRVWGMMTLSARRG